jgi:hypothetical protein
MDVSSVVVGVGSVPAGDQASATRAMAAMPALCDVATIIFPRVWSVCCHRVELPRMFPGSAALHRDVVGQDQGLFSDHYH